MRAVATVFAAALAAASSASAIKVMEMSVADIDWAWTVTGWTINEACPASGCEWDFDVAAKADTDSYPERPAFNAHCSSSGAGAPYHKCTLQDPQPDVATAVVAMLLPSNQTANGSIYDNVQVSMQHVDMDTSTTWWNYTAVGKTEYEEDAPPKSFPMKITGLSGVA